MSIKYVHCGYDWLYETNPLRIVNSEFAFNSKESVVFSYDILDQHRAIDEVKIENIIFSHSFNKEIVVFGRNLRTKFFLKNITFTSQVSHQGNDILAVIFIFSVGNVTFQDIIIENSPITALLVVNSNIYIKGANNKFLNNTGLFGGAIALYSSSISFIMEDKLVSFINNHAKIFGGAIYIEGSFMPNCFFQVQANFNMTTINSTKIYFENNDAVAGSSIHGGI